MNIQIRPAKLEDTPALTTLLRRLNWFHQLKDQSLKTATAQVRRYLELDLEDKSHTVYVAINQADGRILGYSAVHWLPYLFLDGPEGYISELFVSSEVRNSGVGTALLQVIAEEARSRGCTRLSLLNRRSRESYQRSFYRKQGWQERQDMANFILLL